MPGRDAMKAPAVLCCAVLCCDVPRCAVLCCAVQGKCWKVVDTEDAIFAIKVGGRAHVAGWLGGWVAGWVAGCMMCLLAHFAAPARGLAFLAPAVLSSAASPPHPRSHPSPAPAGLRQRHPAPVQGLSPVRLAGGSVCTALRCALHCAQHCIALREHTAARLRGCTATSGTVLPHHTSGAVLPHHTSGTVLPHRTVPHRTSGSVGESVPPPLSTFPSAPAGPEPPR